MPSVESWPLLIEKWYSFIASVATGGYGAAKILMKHLGPVVQARLEARNQQEGAKKPVRPGSEMDSMVAVRGS